MANIKSFPNNQDEYIGAEYVMKWLHGRTSGVFAAENNAAVTAVQNEMAVNLSDGLGWMANAGKDGVVWWIDHEAVNGTKLKLSIDAADSALNRIDRIIVEWKTTNYVDYPEVKVLKGSLASNPTAPALTNNSTVRQISLARVAVAAGTTAITASMITDERLDASVCGLVTESISIDTSVMHNQFEEFLTAIQKELQDLNNGTECLLKAGGTMYGGINMNGQPINGLNEPTEDDEPATKGYVDINTGIAQKTLWDGSWNGGTIDVPGLSKYNLFQIVMEGQGTTILAAKTGNHIRGFGGYSSATPTITTYQFAATFADETLTLIACNSLQHKISGNHGGATSAIVTSIIGLC